MIWSFKCHLQLKEKQNPSIIDGLVKKICWVCVAVPQCKKGECKWLVFYFLVRGCDLGLKRGNVATVFITEHDQN